MQYEQDYWAPQQQQEEQWELPVPLPEEPEEPVEPEAPVAAGVWSSIVAGAEADPELQQEEQACAALYMRWALSVVGCRVD